MHSHNLHILLIFMKAKMLNELGLLFLIIWQTHFKVFVDYLCAHQVSKCFYTCKSLVDLALTFLKREFGWLFCSIIKKKILQWTLYQVTHLGGIFLLMFMYNVYAPKEDCPRRFFFSAMKSELVDFLWLNNCIRGDLNWSHQFILCQQFIVSCCLFAHGLFFVLVLLL